MASSSSSSSSTSDSKDSRWYFTSEQLANSPSRRHGIDANQELSNRQLTAYLIQDMGQRLQVSQLCINTAIVYMHRFYAFHSFTHFHRNGIAAASLFLAAKVEEQPRKLEHVIKVAHICINTSEPRQQSTSELYAEQAQDLVFNENVLLQTLGFDVAIDHPHTHVVKTCHLVKACKDLAQTSYFLASNSLHLTPMCLQYRPTVVACFCIYLACKWSRWEIPQSTEGKHWFHYVDKTVTMDLLQQLTNEFIAIYEKSPARLKSKLNSLKALAQGASISEPSRPIPESPNSSSQITQLEPARRPENYTSHPRLHHPPSSSSHSSSSHHHSKQAPPNEVGDHLATKQSLSHKQSYSGSGSSHFSNRPKPERPQIPNDASQSQYNVPPHVSNKQIFPPPSSRIGSSSRSSTGGVAGGVTGGASSSSSSSQRPPSNHDTNYHKSRSSNIPGQLPGHKMHPTPPNKGTDQQQQQQPRHIMKDSTGKPIDTSKISLKHSSSSMYPPQNPSNIIPDVNRNTNQQQQSVNVSASSRSYPPPLISQPPNYSQAMSNRNNMKYDQSVQQQTHLQQQKQSVESSFSSTHTRHVEDTIKSNDQTEISSPPKFSYPQQLQQQQQQQQLLQSHMKTSSIFSPEWSDKVPPNQGIGSNGNSKNVDHNTKANRDSPKKPERDRRSVTPKKEKLHSSDMLNMEQMKFSQGSITDHKRSSNISNKKFVDNSSIIGGISNNGPSNLQFDAKNQQPAVNLSGNNKRSFDKVEHIFKTEDEYSRDNKLRKTEPLSPPSNIKPFPNTVNGIETNPDLVSSLLKESLCNDSKFIQPIVKNETIYPRFKELKQEIKQEIDMDLEPSIPPPQQQQPQQQQQLQPQPQYQQFDNITTVTTIPAATKEETIATNPLNQEEYFKTKTEKKKKKDKHKHKDKDKSKVKEEKKKHKKDKDKHKDRERSGTETEQNPVKIKISKDKLNLQPSMTVTNPSTSGFKIKIPKDRIKGELSNFHTDDSTNLGIAGTLHQQSIQQLQQQPQQQQQSLPPPPPPPTNSLKIKISKDKIENYNQSQPNLYGSSVANIGNSNTSSHGGHSSSSSSKKKDRDRDRERDKDKKQRGSSSSSSNDFNKSNGSCNPGSGSTGGGSSSSKNQSSNSSKIQQYNCNMSELFGESFDDGVISPKKQMIAHQQLPRYSQSDNNKYYQQQQQQQHQQQMSGNYYNKQ